MMPRIRIIAVGNPLRGDDAAGMAVADELRSRRLHGIDIVNATGEGAELMDVWADSDSVIIVDAARSGRKPGTIVRLDARSDKIPSDFFHYSTHAFSVAEAVELSRAIGELPQRLVIYGIEGAAFEAGRPLSPGVEAAIPHVADRIEIDIQQLART